MYFVHSVHVSLQKKKKNSESVHAKVGNASCFTASVQVVNRMR